MTENKELKKLNKFNQAKIDAFDSKIILPIN